MEKLEILKQKLSKKRKLAVGCLLGRVPVGAALGAPLSIFASKKIEKEKYTPSRSSSQTYNCGCSCGSCASGDYDDDYDRICELEKELKKLKKKLKQERDFERD